MKIDTLILSGGGIKCISQLGAIKYLIENDIISEDLNEIENIICVSGGIVVILPLLLGLTIESTIKLFIDVDLSKFFDFTDIKLDSIIENYGIYSNDNVIDPILTILEHRNINKNITFKGLYELTKKNLVLKTVNISSGDIEYLNHENTPDLDIITGIKMTTCIPLFFQPIKYKGEYYVDGGLCGNFPLEYIKSEYNIFGLNIHSKQNIEIKNLFDYLSQIQKVVWRNIDKLTLIENDRIINLKVIGYPINFEENIELKKNYINEGYHQTEKHFNSLKHTSSVHNQKED
tara:strand:- start:129 stop:995 length:867 start_codon:yes stop_codon:yes gene_type:complete